MNSFISTLKTEIIKIRKTGIFTLSLLFGVFVPLVSFVVTVFLNKEEEKIRIPVNLYNASLESTLNSFLGFFLPVLIIIISSKIAQIDHKNKGWNFMETQPISKFDIYFSKFVLLLLFILLTIITFLLFTFLFSWLRSFFNYLPLYYTVNFKLLFFITIGIRIFITSLCIIALQFVLSVRIKGFIWPILIGFLAMLLPSILSNYKEYLFWYPFSILNQIADYPKGSDLGYLFSYTQILSLLYTVFILFIGYHWYRFRTLKKAFLFTKTRFIGLVIFSLIFGLITRYILKPKNQKLYSKTIISGQITSDKKIENMTILEFVTRDTIAKIDLIDNIFHQILAKDLSPRTYILKIDNYNEYPLYFGNKDSLNITYKLFGEEQELVVKGTRISENLKLTKKHYWDKIKFSLDHNKKIEDAEYYMSEIYKEWKKELTQLNSIRTVDNFIPKNDFLEITKKTINLKYINHWNKFKKLRALLYPNKPYTINSKITKLVSSLSVNDTDMLAWNEYLAFIKNEMLKDDHRKISEDQKYYDAIMQLNKGVFRDKLLFKQLKKSLEEETSIAKRDSLSEKYLGYISKKSYRDLLLKFKDNYNSLSKGVSAYNFVAKDIKNKTIHLSDFKGKIVVIDVWASWCGPCLYQSPYFEKKALKYKNDKFVFISLNVDRKEEDWLLKIQDKNSSVLQLRVPDLNDFYKKFKIETIPRFILIDENGKFIDSNFIRPSDKNFDTLLTMNLD